MRSLEEIKNYYGPQLARAAFRLGAIKLQPEAPFTWASGYRMPIYNDNRMFLSKAEYRALICDAFSEMVEALMLSEVDNIAGTATAGIPHATSLADRLKKSLSYVRSSSKDHGMKNQIEGLTNKDGYEGQSVLLIEDLISTGSSSIKALEAIREAGGNCLNCLAIFTYGLDKAENAFKELDPPCSVNTILSYTTMLQTAKEVGYLDEKGFKKLEEWREDPFSWGEKNGFMKEEK